MFFITENVAPQFWSPVSSFCLWNYTVPAPFVLMPEAAMDKYHGLVLGHHYIGTARQIISMEPEAVPHAMQQ
jgi:hypothetical protein